MRSISLYELDKLLPFAKLNHIYDRDLKGKIAILCPTEELSKDLTLLFANKGYTWNVKNSYIPFVPARINSQTIKP